MTDAGDWATDGAAVDGSTNARVIRQIDRAGNGAPEKDHGAGGRGHSRPSTATEVECVVIRRGRAIEPYLRVVQGIHRASVAERVTGVVIAGVQASESLHIDGSIEI